MSDSGKTLQPAESYAALRTRWQLIDMVIQLLLLTGFVIASGWFRQSAADDLSISELLAGFTGILLAAVIIYTLAVTLTNYFGSYHLRRRFGLTGQKPSEALSRIIRVSLGWIGQALLIMMVLLALRVSVGHYCVGVMILLLAASRLVRAAWRHCPKRLLGYKVKAPMSDQQAEVLHRFAQTQGIRDLHINVLDTSAIDREAIVVYYRQWRAHGVYFSDNLTDLLSPCELTAVFAHELAHRRLKHGGWSLLNLLYWAVIFFAGGELPFLGSEVVSAAQAIYIAPAALLLMYIAGMMTLPLFLAHSRCEERRANKLAMEMTGDPAAFVAAIKKLATNNLTGGSPGLIEKMFIQTHPSVSEVVRQAESYAFEHGIDLDCPSKVSCTNG